MEEKRLARLRELKKTRVLSYSEESKSFQVMAGSRGIE